MSLPKPVQHLKDYWPLWGIVVAVATALTTYIGLPKKVDAVEKKQETLQETFQQYLHEQQLAVAEQRGYQKALNEAVQQQQAPNQAAPTTVWIEPELVDGFQVCTDGMDRWWWDRQRGCE